MATAQRLIPQEEERIPVGSMIRVSNPGHESLILEIEGQAATGEGYWAYQTDRIDQPARLLRVAWVGSGGTQWELDGEIVNIEILRSGFPALCDCFSICPDTGSVTVCEPRFIKEIEDSCGCLRALYLHQCSIGLQAVDLHYCGRRH